MTPDELLEAHRELWRTAFSPRYVAQRLARAARQLRPGAFLLSLAMNSFYGLKRLRRNEPINVQDKAVPVAVGPTAFENHLVMIQSER
jgi:hypothetical protein